MGTGMQFETGDLDTTTTSGITSGGSTDATATNTSLSSSNTHNPNDNRLYGLHALNNLDIAVNGKEVNSMPSYQEIRKRENSVSNSGSVNNLALHHSSDSNSNSNSKVPAKPPRRNSPVQRGHTQMTHYATPALIHSDLESVSSDLKTG